jgi:catecholate siderophore receptor
MATSAKSAPLPLGALMLAASFQSWAQTAAPGAAPAPGLTLPTVTVTGTAARTSDRHTLQATDTGIAKGQQALRDVPQSITVVTDRLMEDRNLDTVKDALRQTSGVTFQAAEGGEEDIRVRGFSLATTGDIYLDGMRDPAFYERDTFNLDRVELIRGSASMLFGRGSTGGAVNQASKTPRAMTEHEVSATVGSHNFRRATADFNLRTGEDAGLRINAMANTADNNGAGSRVDKRGLAVAWRWGIGLADEFTVSAMALDNRNGIHYGLPWIRPQASDTSAANTVIGGLDPTVHYGLDSDRNNGSARVAGLRHVHRFDHGSELTTQVRMGNFDRDQRASAIRFAAAALQPGGLNLDGSSFGTGTLLTRGTNLKIQTVQTTQLQSDLSHRFKTAGLQHQLLAGVDFSREAKTAQTPLTAAQGGVNLVKPAITAASTSGGGWVGEDARVLRDSSRFIARSLGVYAQDLVQVAPHWKLLGGLRHDRMSGNYDTLAIPANAPGPVTITSYQQAISAWSPRLGVLYQPHERLSVHAMAGSSFNTSGDTYSYNAQSANTPPEQSRNLELGARIESADQRFTTRVALFHTTKTHERNTDPDTAASRLLLSGRRHAAGVEVDLAGLITRQWEIYASYTWMPVARVDEAASTATTVGNRVGDRPGLSPRHSGTVWNAWQLAPAWRVGAGLNLRSAQAPADVTAPAWEAPGFATVDLMAEHTVQPGTTLKVNLNNLMNKLYAESLYRGHYLPGAGRLLQVSLTTRF